ncbi:MAG: hypothetical protein VB949_17930 [Pseudomonadales bacterium]|jgi:pyruvate/2-oxoglutarate dehydrogenase complex dihydrolipoamide dehydrogenase (E3) component
MRGMTEAAAREAYGDVVVVHANFNEIARGHISDNVEGLLKLVVSPDRRWISNFVQGSGKFRGKRSEPAVKPDESG